MATAILATGIAKTANDIVLQLSIGLTDQCSAFVVGRRSQNEPPQAAR